MNSRSFVSFVVLSTFYFLSSQNVCQVYSTNSTSQETVKKFVNFISNNQESILTPVNKIFPNETGFEILKNKSRSISDRIIFGNNAQPDQFPFVGLSISYLLYANATDFEPNDSIECTCSLITSQFVVYQAQCIDYDQLQRNYQGSQFFFGSVNKLSFPTMINGVGYAVHPLYNFAGCYMNNIAIHKLQTSVENIEPISLPTRISPYFSYQDRIVTAVGFGATEEDEPSQFLKYTKLQVSSRAECDIRMLIGLRAAPNLICAKNSDSSGVCFGDDGGPLIYQNTLIGIIDSFRLVRTRCENQVTCFDGFAGFLRVDAYLDWIASVTGQSIDLF